MTAKFDYFVILADMRTGSNFLEANINKIDELTCHGEAFNGAFIGYPNSNDILGVTQSERDESPALLIDVIRSKSDGLGGFRYFRDHDPRVLDTILSDPKCAKVVLTRNPLESFVSLQIARATGQWKLTNVKHARREKVHFDQTSFLIYLGEVQDFQSTVRRGLQRTGQTAFYLTYDDLQELEVINGLAAYLGSSGRLNELDGKLKRQNPEGVLDKVSNPEDLIETLEGIDRFDIHQVPNLEPRRGPRVPHYIAAPKTSLLFLPLPGNGEVAIADWLSRLDDGSKPLSGFTRKSLRDWKRQAGEHRSFTVVRHPLARAHAAFCEFSSRDGGGALLHLRNVLQKAHEIDFPRLRLGDPAEDTSHKEAFSAFLSFVQKNLSGQTAVRVHSSWASQTALIQGLAEICSPDLVIRETRAQEELAVLCAQIGRDTMPGLTRPLDGHAEILSRIVDSELQDAARAAYQRDYENFGFGDWTI